MHPDFAPPETLSENLRKQVTPALLSEYSHVAIVDLDVTVPSEFYSLPEKYDADIIGVNIVPSSRLYRAWEKATFWVKFRERVRDAATIYRTDFLTRVGGIPAVETPGTWLLMRTDKTVVAKEVTVIHNQNFSLRHSVKIQIRDGKSRAELHYSLQKTVLHSIFRVRPFVLFSYLYHKARRS